MNKNKDRLHELVREHPTETNIIGDAMLGDSIRQIENEHIEKYPAGEREEIRQIFQKKGFTGETLEKIVETISSDRRLLDRYHAHGRIRRTD